MSKHTIQQIDNEILIGAFSEIWKYNVWLLAKGLV